MQTPGKRIKQARENAVYLNQGEFAKLIGIRQSTLSEIESGETQLPNAKAALIMCELTGVTLRWIIYGEEGEISIPTKQEQELLSQLRSMDEKSRSALIEMAKAIPPEEGR
jgi:DNA-binding XRE family transcriptional regulator